MIGASHEKVKFSFIQPLIITSPSLIGAKVVKMIHEFRLETPSIIPIGFRMEPFTRDMHAKRTWKCSECHEVHRINHVITIIDDMHYLLIKKVDTGWIPASIKEIETIFGIVCPNIIISMLGEIK